VAECSALITGNGTIMHRLRCPQGGRHAFSAEPFVVNVWLVDISFPARWRLCKYASPRKRVAGSTPDSRVVAVLRLAKAA
jgi:hypothetical protein